MSYNNLSDDIQSLLNQNYKILMFRNPELSLTIRCGGNIAVIASYSSVTFESEMIKKFNQGTLDILVGDISCVKRGVDLTGADVILFVGYEHLSESDKKYCIYRATYCGRTKPLFVREYTLHDVKDRIILPTYKEPEVLDEVEKKWLENFLRPFKNKIQSICKYRAIGGHHEFININIKRRDIILPDFKIGTMYKGMRLNKQYTLDELHLFDRRE